MNIGECLVCWSPNVPAIPEARRGAFALVPDTEFARAGARSFQHVSGAPDPRANDARLEVRLEFVVELAHTLVARDRLPGAGEVADGDLWSVGTRGRHTGGAGLRRRHRDVEVTRRR